VSLIVHAPNVHQGGGAILLLSLLRAAKSLTHCVLLADARLGVPDEIAASITLHRFEPTISGRLAAERRLRSLAKEDSAILCLGNLPPLHELKGRVYLFVQNRYLCDAASVAGFPWRKRLRIRAERRFLLRYAHHADVVIVQTPSMRECIRTTLRVDALVAPFFEGGSALNSVQKERRPAAAPGGKFLYVATGEPHKNHRTLLEAWRLLAEDGLFPELHLTLSPSEFAAINLDSMAAHGQKPSIMNHHQLDREALSALYRQVDALIYPSTMESLGLPLIEAKLAGLPVIAPEVDYVRDVIVPDETFDPDSPRSIARAVKRFLGAAADGVQIAEPVQFLRRIIDRQI
jgi:glycosyltransferase involved in cell wall biosynthesis